MTKSNKSTNTGKGKTPLPTHYSENDWQSHPPETTKRHIEMKKSVSPANDCK